MSEALKIRRAEECARSGIRGFESMDVMEDGERLLKVLERHKVASGSMA